MKEYTVYLLSCVKFGPDQQSEVGTVATQSSEFGQNRHFCAFLPRKGRAHRAPCEISPDVEELGWLSCRFCSNLAMLTIYDSLFFFLHQHI